MNFEDLRHLDPVRCAHGFLLAGLLLSINTNKCIPLPVLQLPDFLRAHMRQPELAFQRKFRSTLIHAGGNNNAAFRDLIGEGLQCL